MQSNITARTDGYMSLLNADHQYFYLKVEDCGIGIPEESLEHIYERFTVWTSLIPGRLAERVLMSHQGVSVP